MPKVIIKDLKRCPSCNSSKIYRRVRIIQIEKQKGRKANMNFIEERVKHYRCLDCKYEFDNPKVG